MTTEHVQPDCTATKQRTAGDGTGWFSEDEWVVRFAERRDGCLHGTTTLKVTDDQLTVIRRGEVTMRQVFKPSRETSGRLRHPYGTMAMRTCTDTLQRDVSEDGWAVSWRYRLQLDGAETGSYTITVTIKPRQME